MISETPTSVHVHIRLYDISDTNVTSERWREERERERRERERRERDRGEREREREG